MHRTTVVLNTTSISCTFTEQETIITSDNKSINTTDPSPSAVKEFLAMKINEKHIDEVKKQSWLGDN